MTLGGDGSASIVGASVASGTGRTGRAGTSVGVFTFAAVDGGNGRFSGFTDTMADGGASSAGAVGATVVGAAVLLSLIHI